MREIIKISSNPELLEKASIWFNSKWGVPVEAYRESMQENLSGAAVPQWYVVMENGGIIAGAGVIENDFHKRKDLAPNICAVFTEENYRHQGLMRKLLDHICTELKEGGVKNVYLLTDHTGFYEKCGFSFLCMVEEEGGGSSRCYERRL